MALSPTPFHWCAAISLKTLSDTLVLPNGIFVLTMPKNYFSRTSHYPIEVKVWRKQAISTNELHRIVMAYIRLCDDSINILSSIDDWREKNYQAFWVGEAYMGTQLLRGREILGLKKVEGGKGSLVTYEVVLSEEK